MPTSVCQRCEKSAPEGAQYCAECASAVRAAAPSSFRFGTGEVIDGRYEVIHRIPGGGMGELYKVRHLHLNDIRAIKILRKNQLGDDTYVKRFLREARIAASIKHPNLALLHDFSTLPDKSWYMVEEFVDGTTLAKCLRSGRRFSLDEIVEIARQVLLGLGAIHDKGIIHRDISPDNIMLADAPSGAVRVKIIDLGIARSVDTSEAHSLTSAGLFIGKPHYASPEQMRLIEDDAPLDLRTDLYSLGVVLYEVVSGKVPFEASTPFAYLLKQLSGEVPKVDRSVSDMVPPALENFIVTLLSAKREERFPSSIEALRALSKIRVGKATLQQNVEVPQGDAPFPLSRPSKKRKQTAEIPIEQLQRLIEEDRTTDIRRPAIEPRAVESPEDPRTQIEDFDDSQKITVIQETPVLPTQEVLRPAGPSNEAAEETPLSLEDDSVPVAFVPEVPSDDRLVQPSPSKPAESRPSPPHATSALEPTVNPDARLPRRRDNPLVWFTAGIIFVAVVSTGGYLFYRWLDSRFGSAQEPDKVIESVVPPVSAPPDDAGPASAGDSGTTDEQSGQPDPLRDEAKVTPPSPGPDSRRPPDTRSAARPSRVEPPPAAAESPNPAVESETRTPAAGAPPPDTRQPETATAAEMVPAEATNATADAATPQPADAPVVLPGSMDDVREGDLVAPGPGVIPPEVVKTVEPIYPPLSSNMGKQGVAMFSVLVGPDGTVEVLKLIVSSGSEPLDKSAEDAARQTLFKPATKNGVKVRMWRTLRFEFKKTKGF